MIYNKLEGTTAQSFKLGKNGIVISNNNRELEVIIPTISGGEAYRFLIGVDELNPDSKDIPSASAVVQYIENEIGNVLEGNYLDLSTENIQYVNGPVVFESDITVQGTLKGSENFVIDAVVEGDSTGKLGTVIINGNLQIEGTTTTINSTTVDIVDKNITLASGAENAAAANGAGITIDGANATITYSSSNDNLEINKDIDVEGSITSSEAVTGSQLVSTTVAEEAPIFVFSSVKVDNLNADMLDGKHYSDLQAEFVPKDMEAVPLFQYENSLNPSPLNSNIFVYLNDGTTTGIKVPISDIIRPSVFKVEEETNITSDEKIKIGDFVYTGI
jgi:hypothetical protein